MPIETTLQPRQKWWNILYTVICAVLGLWGAYDYWVTIPRKEEEVARYEAAATKAEELEAKARANTAAPGGAQQLSADDVMAYESAKAIVDKGKPVAPAAYDRPVQMWLYVIGCGVMGAPWFLWQWLAAARVRFRMEDDGTLEAGKLRVAQDHIADIDMSKWMSKSIATVVTTDGKRVVLDDYKYRGMDRIVGAIATRFYPDDWTPDARDLKRIREQEAAEAASAEGGPKVDVNA